MTLSIPDYLRPYVAEQDASLYTPIDHAAWRFILKLSKDYFSKNAHRKYLDGLRETGISEDRIPLISEMDACLRRFNWRAVPVSGFIPPAVFMEFLSLGILPIACEMRRLEHIHYTPAPDIVHEAAGHAPIIADPEYADYLRSYGEISQKAILSKQDLDVYEAIRALSDIKEDAAHDEAAIQAAQKALDEAVARVDHVSEASELARMSWWTIEYGLVGSMENPKIYGAGLLSSVAESYHCLKGGARHIPFSLDCVKVSYDITKPQPQLFVSPDFPSLTRTLDELADTMAFRRGGAESLEKAGKADLTTTTELESGLQISGTLVEYLLDRGGNPSFLRYRGPVQLSYGNREIEGQGADYHREGFSSPVGMIEGLGKPASRLTEAELATMGFQAGQAKKGVMKFASGIVLEGVLKGRYEKNGTTLILSFSDCTIRFGDRVLFDPSWGTFDLACGDQVSSVYAGAADRKKYLDLTGGFKQPPARQKTNLTAENRELNELYRRVREIREKRLRGAACLEALEPIAKKLETDYPGDWLLRYELLEIDSEHQLKAPWVRKIREDLESISRTDQHKAELIARGLPLL